jgi:glutaredoxin 3
MKVGVAARTMSVNELLDNSESDFVMFTSSWCPYCTTAKNILNAKGLSFDEHNVSENPDLQMEVVNMTGHRTVPAIWDVRGERHFVGGCDDLQGYL